MSHENWEEIDLKAASTIQLYLVDEVMYNVMDEETAMELWLRLEALYMTKSLSNKLYRKKQLYESVSYTHLTLSTIYSV